MKNEERSSWFLEVTLQEAPFVISLPGNDDEAKGCREIQEKISEGWLKVKLRETH